MDKLLFHHKEMKKQSTAERVTLKFLADRPSVELLLYKNTNNSWKTSLLIYY